MKRTIDFADEFAVMRNPSETIRQLDSPRAE